MGLCDVSLYNPSQCHGIPKSQGQGQGLRDTPRGTQRDTKGYPKGVQPGSSSPAPAVWRHTCQSSARSAGDEKAIGASPPVKVTIVTDTLDHFKMFFTLIYLFKMLIFRSYVGFTRG